MPSALMANNLSNLYHETRTADGSMRPNWQRVMGVLEGFNELEVQKRQQDIARQLRTNGIAYSPLSDEQHASRPWNLDLAPMIIESDDWKKISSGLEQRATLKQAIFNDIYSQQHLLKEGLIPPALIFAHKGYLRDAVNLTPQQDMPMFSADISRSPSGKWYVVDDVCQYPEGIGYTLENRLVLSQTLPRLFRECRVHRIAGYFKHLQNIIGELSERDGRAVMLASGPDHPHYFEYAFLAKYLGYTLVQAGDLTVRDDRVFLRTVSGLQRVSVIFRFVSDANLDPMANAQSGASGITGLFQAVRTGGVKIINPLGSGILENPALNAYLPILCQHLLGQELELQGPPTYWLGQEDHHQHVMANRDELLFRDVDSQGQLFDPRLMSEAQLEKLHSNISLTPHRYVAQERLDRSVVPAYNNAGQVLQQVTIRCFSARDQDKFSTMAGGLSLLDTQTNGSRKPFDALQGTKDTWVIADAPVMPVSLLGGKNAQSNFAVLDGELPSRVAENLFWMGRNAERCEMSVRLLRSVFQTLEEESFGSDTQDPATVSVVLSAILRATTQATGTLPGFVGKGGEKRLLEPQSELLSLMHEPGRAGSLPDVLNALQHSASSARDRVSDELLRVFNQLEDIRTELVVNPTSLAMFDDIDTLRKNNELLNNTLMLLSTFAGLAHENFTHGDGWRFMMLGRRLERVQHTCAVLDVMTLEENDDVLLLETLLKLFDSVMTYRSRYRSQIDTSLVLRLLLLDEFNPRSLAFQLKQVHHTIELLPGRRSLSQADELSRLSISSLSRVQLAEPGQLLSASKESRQTLTRLLNVLQAMPVQMADILTANYFSHVQTGQQLADLSPIVQPGNPSE